MRRDKSSDLYALGLFIFGIGIVGYILSGCKSEMPKIDVTFWSGDSSKGAVVRPKENKVMLCTDPEFDDGAWLSYENIQAIFDTLLTCQQWPSDIMLVKTQRLMKYLAYKNPEVLKHVNYKSNQH